MKRTNDGLERRVIIVEEVGRAKEEIVVRLGEEAVRARLRRLNERFIDSLDHVETYIGRVDAVEILAGLRALDVPEVAKNKQFLFSRLQN